MKKSRLLTLAFILLGASVIPTLAAMSTIGSVDIDYSRDRDVKFFDLDGPVEALQFRAERGAVHCRDISAKLADGKMHRVFRGDLREGRMVDVDIPGKSQTIRAISFICAATNHRSARVAISADIGRYRPDWQRSPRWNNLWAGIFGASAGGRNEWSQGNRDAVRWKRIGRETFTKRDDEERTSVGWRGLHVEQMALMPDGSDARCSAVVVEFGNGNRRAIDLRENGYLPNGRYTRIDLPGDTRSIRSVRLRCRPIRTPQVSIGIFVNE